MNHFIDPGKPTQNAFVESFNGKLLGTCLNLHWFVDLDDARQLAGTTPAVETEEIAARFPPFPQRYCKGTPPL